MAAARSLFRSTLLLPLCVCATLQAQPDAVDVSRLLFEPVPLPGSESAAAYSGGRTGTAAAAPADSVVDAERRQQAEAAIADYLLRIGNQEAAEGPYDPQLSEDLLSTGLLHQELGAHAEALLFFARAQNISRLNHGIDTPDQIPAMAAMSRSHLALGQLAEADAAEEGLLYIAQQAYGAAAPETAAALHRLGDWNLRAFLDRSNIALNIQRMDVTEFMYGGSRANVRLSNDGYTQESNPTATPLYKLFLAQGNFLEAINILLQARNYADPALLELERKLLTTMFLRTHQENIVYEPDFFLDRETRATGTRLDTSSIDLRNSEDFAVGQASLQRRMGYLVNNEARTAEQVAGTMLEQGDWDLLFERTRTAREKYETAYRFFEGNPEILAAIHELVYPAVPVVLPTFLPTANSREKLGIAPDTVVDYLGYFDVSFSLTDTGKTRRVRILERGGAVTEAMERRLEEYLRRLVFRPRYRDGEPDTGTLSLRYYVAY